MRLLGTAFARIGCLFFGHWYGFRAHNERLQPGKICTICDKFKPDRRAPGR